jgi:hypothetical protein
MKTETNKAVVSGKMKYKLEHCYFDFGSDRVVILYRNSKTNDK